METRYTPSHEWIQLDGNTGTVGITDHAQRELGEIVFIEFPQVGQKVRMGEEVCVLESTKAAADIYAPVSGQITAVNESLKATLPLLKTQAESAGWLFKMEISKPEEAAALLTREGYLSLISS